MEHRDKTGVLKTTLIFDLETSLDDEWEVMSPRMREMFLNDDGSHKRVSLFRDHTCDCHMSVT